MKKNKTKCATSKLRSSTRLMNRNCDNSIITILDDKSITTCENSKLHQKVGSPSNEINNTSQNSSLGKSLTKSINNGEQSDGNKQINNINKDTNCKNSKSLDLNEEKKSNKKSVDDGSVQIDNVASSSKSSSECMTKEVLQCPLCWKKFDKSNVYTSHTKVCASEHNVTTRQLLDAVELHQKQVAERKAIGLPGAPTSQKPVKKPASKKLQGMKSAVNSNNLQLAMALSESLKYAEEREKEKTEDYLIEAGLGEEVVHKNETFLERYGFTSSRDPFPSSSEGGREKSRIKASRSIPLLVSRTQEERERVITEKVAIVLMDDDCVIPTQSSSVQLMKPSLNSEHLKVHQNEENYLWNMAQKSPSSMDKSSYYVNSLSGLISPCKLETGAKLKHLSQLPCRSKLPNLGECLS